MHEFTSSLARRGIDMVADHYEAFADKNGDKKAQVPALFLLVISLTFLAMVGVLFSVTYTYAHIIPTLAMIETAETNAYVAVDNLEEDDNSPPAYSSMPGTPKPNLVDPDVLLVKKGPITSSLRGTVLHLRAKAGWASRFRGLSLFVVWAMSRGFIAGLITSILRARNNPIVGMFANLLAEVCLSTFHLTWIWVVISDPSPLPWHKRLPPFRTSFPRIAPAVAVQALANGIATLLPLLLCGAWGPFRRFGHDYSVPVEKGEVAHAFGQSILLISTMLALFLLLSIPATVTLTRVAASMLPDSDETIVPFDRSFGGKVTPAILGGKGRVGMLEAWRSFGWSQRKNLLKVVAKAFTIIFAVYMLFAIVIVSEVHLIGGEAFRNAMRGSMGQK